MARSFPVKKTARKIKASTFRKNAVTHLTLGIIRGFGMAIGFSGLAVILLAIIQFIPLDTIPVIGDIIKTIIDKNK